MSENNSKNLLDSFKPYPFKFLYLPLEVIEADQNQPRKILGSRTNDHIRLAKSILHYGIEDPLKVSEIEEGRYLIMDGHRRFACAKELKFEKVPCRIYPKMNNGEFEARRYEMQNNRRSWRPLEKANAIHKIRSEYDNASKKEIADLIGITEKNLFHFTELRDVRIEYLELMSGHNMKEHQMIVFMQLLPKLRKIRQYEVDDIIKILFQKIHDNILYRRIDFNSLSKIFSVASLHEEELQYFLTEPKASVTELCEMAQLTGISVQIRNLIRELNIKRNLSIRLTEKEQSLFGDLYTLMDNYISPL
jgi:ParB/RepB/Spo0J family partition protein